MAKLKTQADVIGAAMAVKHHGEVVEVTSDPPGIAVQFLGGRVEWISQGQGAVGDKGWVTYRRLLYGFGWAFEPYRD